MVIHSLLKNLLTTALCECGFPTKKHADRGRLSDRPSAAIEAELVADSAGKLAVRKESQEHSEPAPGTHSDTVESPAGNNSVDRPPPVVADTGRVGT